MNLTDDQINELKVKYGKFKVVTVEDNDKEYYAVLKKKVSRTALSKALTLIEKDPILSNEIIYRDVVISEYSSKEILEDDSLFLSVSSHLQDLFEQKKTKSVDY